MADVAAGRHARREELAPFLDPISSSEHALEHQHPPPKKAQEWPWLLVVALVIAVAVVSDIGEALFSVPKVRLFESAICARYHAEYDPDAFGPGKHDIPEHLCKLDPIQDSLAGLLGWQLFFEGVPAILLPVPFGHLADQLGRRWILACALAGFAMSYLWTLFIIGATDWPTQWVWLSPAFYLLGGGPIVASNLLTTIVADVVPPESRSTVFFYRFCTDFVANLAIPPIASLLMSKNIWIPLLSGALFQASSVVMVLAIPESAPANMTKESEQADEWSPIDMDAPSDGVASFVGKRYKLWLRRARSSLSFILRDNAIAAIIWTFLLFEVGLQSKQVLFQYASKRYGWTLAQAALLPTLRSAITIVLFTAVLPGLTAYMSRYISKPALKDLLLAKGSIVLLLLGAIVLSISATSALMISGLVIFSLGSGFEPAARSLVTALVEANSNVGTSKIGGLYAIISVMEGVGKLIAALGMSFALRVGLRMGELWYGLPFAVAAALFAIAGGILFRVDTRHLRLSSDKKRFFGVINPLQIEQVLSIMKSQISLVQIDLCGTFPVVRDASQLMLSKEGDSRCTK
ncbi:hypothetical protein CKM354_000612200 [Cercospora kikuchii]|uniref:Major facilitator superfamily (MFS) profile domain-containing protein n=1 Tax=Cercospora kikuchii TaxID=84275 RepID=A0A9P3FG69_9PEZI|nr:uncharacterized protein CKM354_000612200 [Cercospora kikuchii]GIZ42872.1 hypothetical protein CKM354_000612200 [Cercospora kikuchii]